MDRLLSIGVRDHFDNISPAYYDIVDKVWYDVGYYHTREAEFLRVHVRSRLSLAIDAGCGPGRHTSFLASVASRVAAVDVSRRMLELAAARLAGNDVDLIQADVRCLPFKEGIADLVVNLEVLEHLPGSTLDIGAAFREFRRVLKPNGTLVTQAPLSRHRWWHLLGIGQPSWKEIPDEVRRKYYHSVPLAVVNSYQDERVELLLRECGFTKPVKDLVRVFPARMIEQYPGLAILDRLLEHIPLINRLAREAIWMAKVMERRTVQTGLEPTRTL